MDLVTYTVTFISPHIPALHHPVEVVLRLHLDGHLAGPARRAHHGAERLREAAAGTLERRVIVRSLGIACLQKRDYKAVSMGGRMVRASDA